jgi:hypothetical protein
MHNIQYKKQETFGIGKIDFDLKANRQEQCVVCRVNDADEHRSACFAFKAVAFEAALVDVRLVAPIEHNRRVAFWACDFLWFRKFRCLDRRRHGRFFGHYASTSMAL